MPNDADLEIRANQNTWKTLSPLGWVILITAISFITLLISILVCIIQIVLKIQRKKKRQKKSSEGLTPLPFTEK